MAKMQLVVEVTLDKAQLTQLGPVIQQALGPAGQAGGAALKQGVTPAANEVTQALSGVVGQLRGVVPGAGLAQQALSRMSFAGADLSKVMGAMIPVAVVAGIIALNKAVMDAVDTFVRIGDEVHNFQEVAGGSAEQASQLVYLFKTVGLSADTAAQAAYNLNNRINANSAAFQAARIVIARTADGQVDLVQTMRNVHEQYQAAGSAAERDTILFAAFGRAGRDLNEVMSLTNEQFDAIVGRAPLISEEQIAAAKEYSRNTAELNQQLDALKVSSTGDLVRGLSVIVGALRDAAIWTDKASKSSEFFAGFLDGLAQTVLGPYYWISKLGEAQGDVAATGKDAAGAMDDMGSAAAGAEPDLAAITKTLNDEASAAQKLADLEVGIPQRQLAVEASTRQLSRAQQELANYQQDVADKTYALRGAQDDLEDAQNKAAETLKKYGSNTEEYQRALDDVERAHQRVTKASQDLTDVQASMPERLDKVKEAQLGQVSAYEDLAKAMAEQETEQDRLNGRNVNATEQNYHLLNALDAILAHVSDPDVQAQLIAYGQTLDSTFHKRDMVIDAHLTPGAKAILQQFWAPGSVEYTISQSVRVGGPRQGGGPIVPGQLYTVAESPGQREFVMTGPTGQGYVWPNPPIPAGTGAGVDLRETNALLRELVAIVSREPSGSGVAVALNKAVQLAGLNRLRGMSGG